MCEDALLSPNCPLSGKYEMVMYEPGKQNGTVAQSRGNRPHKGGDRRIFTHQHGFLAGGELFLPDFNGNEAHKY